MFHPPDHYHNLSLRLSDVMDDIGVNERIVMRRRRAWLLYETIRNIHSQLNGKSEFSFYFGSQTEGCTTVQLMSDMDILLLNKISVIQDWLEWKLGKLQLLMVQDETTSPGYCLLQVVRPDIPLPKHDVQQQEFTTDSRGRVLIRHSAFFQGMLNGTIRHGPARTATVGSDLQLECDMVSALYCSSWPKEAESWLQQQNVSGWPTEHMKRYVAEQGCFVVPVASHSSVNPDSEFRISTSFAERCLMFSLNMTQIRCYILMKMIIKTKFKPKCGDIISSFICKTVLFHCISDTRASKWNNSNLLPCLNQCLHFLLHCILTENCPHFIITGNNLLAGKLPFQTKQKVVEIMMTLTANIEQSLLGISIDQLGNRLHVKSGRMLSNHVTLPELITGEVLLTNVSYLMVELNDGLKAILKTNTHNNVVYQNLKQNVSKLCHIYSAGSRLEQAACCLYATPLCSIIGSIIASENIHHSQQVSPAALQWFSAGLNSDFSSSRLKLASALYCAGHYEQCETILVHLNRQLEQTSVLTVCNCAQIIIKRIPLEFVGICQEKNEVSMIQQNIAFCVCFFPSEVNCVPKDLRYEMFRSTEGDLPYRGRKDYWMDWAVVEAIPFLYFLQYKVYSQLHRPAQQQQALLNLARTIDNEPNLHHRETVMNILGQCMEEENKIEEALCCYMMSLTARPRNNVAKWHLCKLLSRLLNN